MLIRVGNTIINTKKIIRIDFVDRREVTPGKSYVPAKVYITLPATGLSGEEDANYMTDADSDEGKAIWWFFTERIGGEIIPTRMSLDIVGFWRDCLSDKQDHSEEEDDES